MSGYPLAWLRGWLLGGTAGTCLAMLVWPPGVALFAVVTVLLATALIHDWAQRRSPDRIVLGRYGAPRREVVAALGLGVVGIRALGDVSPTAVFWVLLALVVTHPALVGLVRGLASTPADGLDAAAWASVGGSAVAATPVSNLTTAELCEAWRASSRLLSLARTSQELQRAAALRQAYLDEMGRRDPAGLSAWLESGARPTGGSPERYLRDWTVTEGE